MKLVKDRLVAIMLVGRGRFAKGWVECRLIVWLWSVLLNVLRPGV